MIAECHFHGERFNSLSHQPLVLNACEHTQCRLAFEDYLNRTGRYQCPVCKTAYFTHSDTNEIATRRAVKEIEELEVKCDLDRGHGSGIVGYYLCKLDKKVYCDTCKHANDCCSLPESLSFEITQMIREEEKKADIGEELKYAIRNIRSMPAAQARYDLLRKCIEYEGNGEWKCPLHKHLNAVFLHRDRLEFACEECAAGKEGYVDLKMNAESVCKEAICAFLDKIDCYAIPYITLRDLYRISLLSRKALFELTVRISQLPASGPIGESLFCPGCLSAVNRLIRLNCACAVHGICDTCASVQIAKGSVICPLDGNLYVELGTDIIKSTLQAISNAYIMAIDDTDPINYGSRATEAARRTPGFQGTKLPEATIGGAEVLSRFWAVYPPFNIDKSALLPWMMPWEVYSSLGQVEALGLMIDTPIVLIGATISCPVDSDARATIRDLKITVNSENSPIISVVQPIPADLYGNKPSQDVFFQPKVSIPAHHEAVLSFKLSSSQEIVKFYRGNHVTAPDVVRSVGVGEWRLFQPNIVGAIFGGDNGKTGLILRLFYN